MYGVGFLKSQLSLAALQEQGVSCNVNVPPYLLPSRTHRFLTFICVAKLPLPSTNHGKDRPDRHREKDKTKNAFDGKQTGGK